MNIHAPRLTCIVIGNESLAIQCAEVLMQRGHSIAAVVTQNGDVRAWGLGKGLRVEAQDAGLSDRLAGLRVDWLLSIANLVVIPDAVLALARGAVNFHDGPLPRYAGLNAPVWAIANGEAQHGITWHLIEGGIDEGDILEQRLFPIADTDTALTLNTKCFEAAIDSFPVLVAALETGAPQRRKQDLAQRSYFARAARPAAAGVLDFAQPAASLSALVRALDHGTYFNPLTLPKIMLGDRVLCVGSCELVAGDAAPGTALAADAGGLTVACADGVLRLSGLTDQNGRAVEAATLAGLPVTAPNMDALTRALAAVAPGEVALRRALTALEPAEVPMALPSPGFSTHARLPLRLPAALDTDARFAALALAAARLSAKPVCDMAFVGGGDTYGILSTWVPLRVDAQGTAGSARAAFAAALAKARKTPAFALDLIARDRGLRGVTMPPVALTGVDAPVPGAVLTLAVLADDAALHYDSARLSAAEAAAIATRFATFADAMATAGDAPVAQLPLLPDAERAQVLHGWNATATDYDRSLCVHQAFEAQVLRSPDATAIVFEAESLTYAALNARANRAAHVLIAMGVTPGTLVGLCTRRSLDLLVGALAIQKAGGAYVPMDPAYPADRIALFIEDSAAPVVVTQSALAASPPAHAAQTLCLDADPRLAASPDTNPQTSVTSADLAYMIYTSGSTGRPKGVMIEHRNVLNFFTGMDGRIPHDPPGVWMAVTSLSFDISVLELFWTLARGFKIVITSDENRALVSSGRTVSAKPIDFSLYYWGNDDGTGAKKYELLLEGAKFADDNGFIAVWTPERHFHAFGGPYPNPAVTGAAIAGLTKNIDVRAGSCVAPLHHPARIAEDWAVIDNLTGGRVGLAMASGWQPDDFVLRPENTPPNNRKALFDAIDQVRRLWRGEAVEFPTANGTPFAVVTQPRPISRELPVWVTTAGNPETWREAGAIGANVLTHLLGQTVAEVATKIGIYHQALRDAGHDPATRTVTLMLHTYLAATRDLARDTAREPMKDYLRSAAGLIKQYAWAFPAFKKPQGVTNPMQIDLQSVAPEEMEGILDFAFQRYFDDSGLFGTMDDALARVEELKAIGVNEVACLIDYGIANATVLEGLKPLAEVLRRANQGPAEDDYSIAAQLARHRVTHLQCTPSMARMIAMNDDSRAALAGVKTLMLGGEALPGALVQDLRRATQATVENMYGPTETTIWSSTETASGQENITNIGRPIANTQLYVLDDALQPAPVGTPGELWIGGDGVARGYWQRPDLTADRFRPDPFVTPQAAAPWGARMYRTGDLVRWRADGKVDFIGRADHQVKLRGYRIELGEIEAVLEQQPGITQAVVLAREDTPGDLRLVAYVTGAAPNLKETLAARLPEHMVPAHIVTLASFPQTPNRKVDRKALPAPQAAVAAPRVQEAPAEGVQAQIAAIWSRVLGVPNVGPKDNFFELGGHSLLAVQAHRDIKAALNSTKMSIIDIFRYPVLAELAAYLDDSPKALSGTAAGQGFGLAAGAGAGRADARADAMARRRALRAGKQEA
ncbi:LLM class flavin-dependent oxidoreductase [Fertoebacter nigrum]|uniref:LLM class flavin-dependent oxidoreductase n=1 Tax=Fertoeibacter niger TaxID=2656921 RepID=A0A8X8H3K3_9RHOB|nr:MupA/Atu3671 family FMN-dependent luciferase-like monooxygenase [Fertoeibacter niger]NUB44948.1 LLM class flavin-dependent oxidoreductase [Fertoeibacter niger]